MTAPFVVNLHMPIDAEDREVAAELQSMLVELIDLALIGKQVHWNVEGPHFRSLHLELDELVDAWRALGDDVAERAGTLGAAPDGQAATVASQSDHAASGRPPQGLRRGQGGCRPGNRGRGTRASAHRSRSRPRPGFGGPPHRGAAHTREAALDPAGAACALLRRHPPGGALSDGSEAAERRPGPLRARPRSTVGGRVDRGVGAHRSGPGWLLHWGGSPISLRSDVPRESPDAPGSRKWGPAPIRGWVRRVDSSSASRAQSVWGRRGAEDGRWGA